MIVEAIRLNLGAGDVEIEGFAPVDIRNGQDARRLDFADDSVAEIRASHVLEHIGHGEVQDALAEWVRVLRPGGRLRVAVPDFRWIAQRYLEHDREANLEGICMGGQTHEHDYHKAIFDEPALRRLLQEAGLIGVRRWESTNTDCAALACSLNLEGRKPAGELDDLGMRTVACMSLPRLMFTDCAFSALSCATRMGLRIVRAGGGTWGQALTRAFEIAVKSGAEFILAIDYDSVFTAEDVKLLYSFMLERPDIDALCPLQIARERGSPILTVRGDDGELARGLPCDAFDVPLMPINTGHFGLSFLRTAGLTKLPKPWFLNEPDAEGGWGDGRFDEDGYFWRQWRDCTLSVWSASDVRLGHLELLITWPNASGRPVRQTLTDYYGRGRPARVR